MKKSIKKRLQKYYDIIEIIKEHNVSMRQAKQYLKHGTFGHWEDDTSPTGYSQKCGWQGNCQYPCNGDC